MISFLDGEVVEKGATRVVIGVGGVGYDVLVPTSVVAKLPAVGKTTRLHTRMVVREDSMTPTASPASTSATSSTC